MGLPFKKVSLSCIIYLYSHRDSNNKSCNWYKTKVIAPERFAVEHSVFIYENESNWKKQSHCLFAIRPSRLGRVIAIAYPPPSSISYIVYYWSKNPPNLGVPVFAKIVFLKPSPFQHFLVLSHTRSPIHKGSCSLVRTRYQELPLQERNLIRLRIFEIRHRNQTEFWMVFRTTYLFHSTSKF